MGLIRKSLPSSSSLNATWLILSVCARIEPILSSCLIRHKHDIDLTSVAARRLESLTLVNSDMALEQPRPLPPALKLVGPIMARPAAALPPDLQVACLSNPCCFPGILQHVAATQLAAKQHTLFLPLSPKSIFLVGVSRGDFWRIWRYFMMTSNSVHAPLFFAD